MPRVKNAFKAKLHELRKQHRLLGFFIDFQSKTMLNARAYLPSICSLSGNSNLVSLCPMRLLIAITDRDMVSGYFLRKLTSKKALSSFLLHITGATTTVAAYALRIEGRTWKLSNGMDRQLVDFLGTWKSPEASARYFRGNPSAILRMVRKFYLACDPFRTQRREGAMGDQERRDGCSGATVTRSAVA